ncbi:MAG: thioredoxin domain-containing protein [Anaerolineae bacterium]|nr:thioredoxin domain-containing protein [Anaerolineae bacterium]
MADRSRSRARDRKRERERERRRNRQLAIVAGIIVVALVLGGLFLVANLPADAPLPETAIARISNLQQSFTEEGYPLLGNPDAPVEVRDYSSFSCPGCAAFHDDVLPQLLPRIERGEISFVYVPLQTGSIPNAGGAARTAICAGEQGKFWEMHEVLFDWHSRFVNTAFQGNRLTAGIEALGLDVDAYNACFNSARVNAVLDSAQAEGVTSTPTIQIDGVTLGTGVTVPTAADILAAIDARGPFENLVPGTIQEEAPAEEAVEATEEVTVEETEMAAEPEATVEVEATEAMAAEATAEATQE